MFIKLVFLRVFMDNDYYVFKREYFTEPETGPIEDYVLYQEERKKLIRQEIGVDFTENLFDIWNISEFLRSENVKTIFTLKLPPGGHLGFYPVDYNPDTEEGGYEEYSCLNKDDIYQFKNEGLEVIVLEP